MLRIAEAFFETPQALAVAGDDDALAQADLVLVFAARQFFETPDFPAQLARLCPRALIAGCSSAGEIRAAGVSEDGCVLAALRFQHTTLKLVSTTLAGEGDSHAAGARLAAQLRPLAPRAVLLFAPGVHVNGSALADGLAHGLGPAVAVAGGLAGDGTAFARTYTIGPAGVADNAVVALALCGEALRFGAAAQGGWLPFGPARQVTACSGNVLHALDGQPALALYRHYLGDYAAELPASALLFPLAILDAQMQPSGVIRTILGIDERAGSLILAGSVEAGSYLQLMQAGTNHLVDAAEMAAETLAAQTEDAAAALVLLVSCVGRRLVMGARVDEEVEAVAATMGSAARLIGFYSYGEIGPAGGSGHCLLNNQTMTLARIAED